jgi:biotin operon repressor
MPSDPNNFQVAENNELPGLTRAEIVRSDNFITIPKTALADPSLTSTDKLVLGVVITAFGPAKNYTWMGQEAIARELNIGERTVRDSIARLTLNGYLRAHPRHKHHTTAYTYPAQLLPADSAAQTPAEISGQDESSPADSAAQEILDRQNAANRTTRWKNQYKNRRKNHRRRARPFR